MCIKNFVKSVPTYITTNKLYIRERGKESMAMLQDKIHKLSTELMIFDRN